MRGNGVPRVQWDGTAVSARGYRERGTPTSGGPTVGVDGDRGRRPRLQGERRAGKRRSYGDEDRLRQGVTDVEESGIPAASAQVKIHRAKDKRFRLFAPGDGSARRIAWPGSCSTGVGIRVASTVGSRRLTT